MDELPKTPSG